MQARLDILFLLLEQFAVWSVMAVGGANILLPEFHQFAVEQHRWMSHREFGELFALAQAAPGPNVLFVALVGWKAAGVPGAFAAMLGICGPSSAMTLAVAHTIERFREARWRILLQKALAPVTAGLMIASALLLMRPGEMASHGWILSLIVLIGALALKLNPLWFIGVGALAGATVF